MRPAHVTTEGLAMRKNFTASLAHVLAITLFLNDLLLRHLSLLVGLRDVASDQTSEENFLARRGRCLLQRCI